MVNILIITLLVVAIIICFIMLSMCNVIKDADLRSEEIKRYLLKNKRMANAEPVRELKYKTDTGLCITKCPYVFDSIKIGSNKCGMCIHNRGNSLKKKVVFCAHPDAVAVNKYSNAEPGNYRCCICGKKISNGGTFKRYNGKWYCIDCCDWIKKTKREAEFNKVRKTFEIKAGDK